MTTTSALFDLDELKDLNEAATPAPWQVDFAISDGTHEISAAPDVLLCYCVGTDHDVTLIVKMRNALPALLDELAKLRREVADANLYGHEMAGKVVDLCRDMGMVQGERDAAREELAKTAALLERAQNELNAYRRGDLPHVVLEEVRRLDSERTAELAKTRAELDTALPFLRAGALAEHHSKCGESSQWDIRRCEDADCLERAHLLEARGLIPQEWDTYTIPDANPATTAEPAAPHTVWDHYAPCTTCGAVAGKPCVRVNVRPGHYRSKPHWARELADTTAEPADEPKATEVTPR